jgi:NADPH-dependent 2,4-dienoyl-CoA reductase/sulfur reductase-like enzyme/rhodanese-related sulfurtransferase
VKNRTILIAGGALAGPTAAARARETDEHSRIILIERNRHVSYAQCGLAYQLSGEVSSIDDLNRERADFFRNVYGIEVWTEAEIVAINPARHDISVRRENRIENCGYDSLVVALGAASLVPAPLNTQANNLVCFRTLDDLEKINQVLATGKRRVAVVGGGPMGVEAADGLIRAGADVTLIESEPRLLNIFGERIAAQAKASLQSRARVLTQTTVGSVETAGGSITALRLTNGEQVATDLVIAAAGIVPRSELLHAASASLAAHGTVPVDERAATSLPDVYACGVCVSVPQVITGNPVWLPQGAVADKTAQVAGANAAGGAATLSPALGSMLLRVADTVVGRAGLSQRAASDFFGAGEVAVTTVYAPSCEHYVPHAALMLVQLLWHRGDGRILGVEAAAKAGVDKRIDAAAGVLASGLTVERLAGLDFGYEPPYNAARDPLNVAATVAALERAGRGHSLEPEALAARLATTQIIDVRPEGADGSATVPGAVRIPLELLRRELGKLDRTRPVVAVSETGRRGWLAARILAQNGFADAANLAGGLLAWALTR